jgi:hypothetical protein
MLKIAKTIVLIAAMALSSMATFASSQDTIITPDPVIEENPLHVRMWSDDIYFFSMDWYNSITVFSEHGDILEIWNVEWMSEIQCTAWPSISIEGWPDGTYVFELTGEDCSKKYIMIMEKGSIVMYSNNPERQQ